MTTQELARLQQGKATLTTYTEALEVAVKILDSRQAYGRLDLLVTPTQGSGEAWVSADRVKVKGA